MVFTQIQNNMFLIQALTGFSLADPATGIDVGYEVREKAQRLIGLIRSGFSDDKGGGGGGFSDNFGDSGGFGSPAAAPAAEDAWKSSVQWDDEEDGPAAGASAGKFSGMKIRDAPVAASGAALRGAAGGLTLGATGTTSGGRSRPQKSGSIDMMGSPSKL